MATRSSVLRVDGPAEGAEGGFPGSFRQGRVGVDRPDHVLKAGSHLDGEGQFRDEFGRLRADDLRSDEEV